MKCSDCGKEIKILGKFCGSCGAELSSFSTQEKAKTIGVRDMGFLESVVCNLGVAICYGLYLMFFLSIVATIVSILYHLVKG